MKISVLLPTRNRLTLLRYAVESVLRQDYDDWEVIISDNHSEEDIAGYVAGLNDPRVLYSRTGTSIPVTENWNLALKRSSGDYIVMLGDDDCLTKGYFRTVSCLAQEYRFPDFLYHKALVYAYPGVVPGFPDGYLRENACAPFFNRPDGPFLLDPRTARSLVAGSMNFRVLFDFNMQYSLISRRFMETLKGHGDFFQSPYPDYYASNVMFLKGKKVLVYPKPLVIIGVSPKSFGYYFSNLQEEKGVAFLGNTEQLSSDPHLSDVILPGTAMNTSWLIAMELLRRNYDRECAEHDLRVNYLRYRFLQILTVYYGHYRSGTHTREQVALLRKSMKLWERILIGWPLALGASIGPSIGKIAPSPGAFFWKHFTPYPNAGVRSYVGKYENILDVFERVNPLA